MDHFEINKSIWPVVEEVRKHCRVGLLTNMYPGMFAAIKEKDLLPDVPWEIVVDSSVVGMKKLDRGIYDLAREKAGVENVEIFFVDNNEDNIKTAEELGWKVFHYDPVNPEESSRKLLKEFKSEYLL